MSPDSPKPTVSGRVLYKYRPFDAKLLQQLCNDECYYASPKTFNDPLDCNPVLTHDVDRMSLESAYDVIRAEVTPCSPEIESLEQVRYLATEHGNYNSEKAVECWYEQLLVCNIRRKLAAGFGELGVACFSETWECPLMWSHYADQHRGVCIEFGTDGASFLQLGAVDYRSPRAVLMSDVVSWKCGGHAEAQNRVEQTWLFVKAGAWSYEREWRDVSSQSGSRPSPARIRSILFGERCDAAVRTFVVSLYRATSMPMEFYEVSSSGDGFGLGRRRIDAEEILACGMRFPLEWPDEVLHGDAPERPNE